MAPLLRVLLGRYIRTYQSKRTELSVLAKLGAKLQRRGCEDETWPSTDKDPKVKIRVTLKNKITSTDSSSFYRCRKS